MSDLVELLTYGDLLWPTVLAVRELGGAAHIRQIDALAIELAGLTERRRTRMHRGSVVTEADYRLAWARRALKGMGALENIGRGRWELTPLGKTMPEAQVLWRLDLYLAELKDTRHERTTSRSRPAPIRIMRLAVPQDARPPTLESLEEFPVGVRLFAGPLPDPVETLEANFATGGISLIAAVFQNTFFLHPSVVRRRTPHFPDFARYSRTHYGSAGKGVTASWQGSPVRLDDNKRAQSAWQKYSGRALSRGAGFTIRHIWGHPWDPLAFTGGWNLAYMPNWAGMLTEEQHPHPIIQQAVRQASWDLFFVHNPVCPAPDYVTDPGLNLTELLNNQPLLVLAPGTERIVSDNATRTPPTRETQLAVVRSLRARSNSSWSNLSKAIASLQGRRHEPFGTANVEASAKSVVRRMCRDGTLSLDELEQIIREMTVH